MSSGYKLPSDLYCKGGSMPVIKQDDQKKKIVYLVNGSPDAVKPETVLSEYKTKFYTAYANSDHQLYDSFELIYRGTQKTTANVNSKKKQNVKKTNVVRNIAYEIIESQINTDVPEPKVKSNKPGFLDQAKMIEEKITADIEALPSDRMADTLERHTYTNGVGLVALHWNITKGNHNELGEKELINKHPKQIIPQPGVYEVEKMDYIFYVSIVTKDYIKNTYGIEVDDETFAYPEMNQITGDDYEQDASKDYTKTEDLVTETVCWYKDDDNDVCKITWVGETIVEFEPKYYFPRTQKCKDCGMDNSADAELCSSCQGKKLEKNISTVEVIEQEMALTPISFTKKQKKVVDDTVLGRKRVVIDIIEDVTERIVPAGTEIPRFAIDRFPIIKRINIPLAFSFRGVSDIEVIQTLQESLKKVLSRIEEKVLLAVSVIAMPKGMDDTLSNDIYRIIKGKPADIGQIQFFDINADISQDLEYAATLYEYAKSTIGVTDAFQGKYDPSARTGKAKEVQVQQSAGRLESKYKNKYIFYSELFQLMYYFDLMFASEIRPYSTTDALGTITYKEFDRYELLCQDDAGEWYFNTDFVFRARQASEIPSDDVSIMDKAMEMAQNGMLEKDQFWQVMGELNFPMATKLLEQTRSQMDQKVESLLGAMKMMDPQMVPQFLQLETEEQMEMLSKMLEEKTKGQ